MAAKLSFSCDKNIDLIHISCYYYILSQSPIKPLWNSLIFCRYRENAVRISRAFNDRPLSPLDTAIFWTEYVIRHAGAPHLRTAAVELAWYQYLLLDVCAVFMCVVVSACAAIFYVTTTVIQFLLSRKGSQKKKRQWRIVTSKTETSLSAVNNIINYLKIFPLKSSLVSPFLTNAPNVSYDSNFFSPFQYFHFIYTYIYI